jgi:hypothetical protein
MPSFKLIGALVLIFLLRFFLCAEFYAQSAPPLTASEIVNKMVQAERAAWKVHQHYLYINDERSNRTNGHLWRESVVEATDGSLERLLTEDGVPLSAERRAVEEKRITGFVNHPTEFRRKSQRRHEDEARMPELLEKIPQIFLFKTVSTEGEFTLISFEPNPDFHEQSYQDRVLHATTGTITIHTADMRLSRLDARLAHKVEFGFGLLGVINESSTLSLARAEISPDQWTTTEIQIHLDGSIFLLKSLSRDVKATRSEFKAVANELNVAEAAELVRGEGLK